MEKILKNCYYIPMDTMRKVIDCMESSHRSSAINLKCKRNLLKLQQNRTKKKFKERNSRIFGYYDKKWKTMFRVACWKAIYAHNWDKLLYLLKKIPPWELNELSLTEKALYMRALMILLMYHKSSQTQGLLNEYLHLVWSCRTTEDKKAALKIMLSLPEKIYHISFTNNENIFAF